MPAGRLRWVLLLVVGAPLSAQQGGSYDLRWSTLKGGSGSAAGASVLVDHTLGQFEASPPMTGGSFELAGGFWAGVEIPPDALFANGFEQ